MILRLDEILKRTGVIILLDILGTKNMWQDQKAKIFLKKVNRMYDKLDYYEESITTLFGTMPSDVNSISIKGNSITVDDALKDYLKSVFALKLVTTTFSDTMIIALYGDRAIDSAVFINLLGTFLLIPLFRDAFLNGIYLRGTVSFGNFYILEKSSRLLIVGPAINEAAESYSMSEWIGISAAPSTFLALKHESPNFKRFQKIGLHVTTSRGDIDASEQIGIMSCFIDHDIPLKTGFEKEGLALAWPLYQNSAYHSNTKFERLFEKQLDYRKFQEKPVPYEIYRKLSNTRQFYKKCVEYKAAIDMSTLSFRTKK